MTIPYPVLAENAEHPRAGARAWCALVVLMLPVLLVSIDNTVLSFALPHIALALAPSGIQQLWIIDVYPLVLAALLVTMGTLGDRWGRRRMLLIGATGFAAVSAIAAFAPSAAVLIAARAGLGVFGAMLMPSTLSLLRSIFQHREQRRLAIAVWASAFSGGAALGPIVGGFLLEHFAWGSVFLIAIPVLIPLLIAAPFLVPESSDPHPGQIDPLSILFSVAALFPIVYAIKEFAGHGFSFLVVLLVALGVVATALFVRRQLRSAHPMLDMQLFRLGDFSGAIVVNLLSIVALVGFLYFVSQHLQLVLGLDTIAAGLALLPGMLAMIVAGLAVVPIARRHSPHIVIPVALAFSVFGYVVVAFTSSAGGVLSLALAFVSLGVGIGAAETVSNELILSSAPPAKAGAASAVSETAYELGAVLGTAVLGGLMTALYRAGFVAPAGVPAEAARAAKETLAGARLAADAEGGATGRALWDAAATAFEGGIMATSLVGAALIGVAILVATFALRTRGHS